MSTSAARIPVQVKRLPHGRSLPLPAYETPGAAGMDLRAALDEPVAIPAGACAVVPTGLAVAIPSGYEGQIRPRSGLAAKHSVLVPNSPGTVDSDYRGEIRVILLNMGGSPFTVEPEMRIAQLIIAPVVQAEWRETDELPVTSRGGGGFGHTGTL